MTITTITINQYRIKENASLPPEDRLPVICVNRYAFHEGTTWGPKIGETEHYHEFPITAGTTVYDPVNKTPCGASCWVEVYDA